MTTVLHDALRGPWRAVLVLGVTQIVAWGTIFYSPVLMMPLIAAERGWSLSFAMGGFSLGLLIAGIAAPFIGAAIDRRGGHVVMAAGSLVAALGLALLPFAAHPVAFLAVWMLLGLGLAASLYDAAFATLGRIFGAAARRPITVLTLAGGFASTLGWPATYLLTDTVGWRHTYLIYAALLALVCAPLHALALPRTRASLPAGATDAAAKDDTASPHGAAFLLVAAAFACYAFVPSALSAHLLAIFGRAGIAPETVVAIGALFGPAQVGARVLDLTFGRRAHPLAVARFAVGAMVVAFAMLALLGLSAWTATAFALMFGAANGLLTIARGAVPLALFGPRGYGRVIGRIAGPSFVMQAMAPLVLAVIAERLSDPAALAFAAMLALIATACFLAIRKRA